jgi:hypothetical protein
MVTTTDEQDSGSSSRKNTTTTFTETLNLDTEGDIYHPKLFTYIAAVGLGLTQEDFESDERSQKTKGDFNSYSFTANILQGKPYPITVRASRSETLSSRRFQSPIRNERENSGADIYLRFPKWPMFLRYNKTETSQKPVSGQTGAAFSRTEERFKYLVSHQFSRTSNMRFEFSRKDISSKSGTSISESIEDRYVLNHYLRFGDSTQHRLDSIATVVDNSGIGAGSGSRQKRWTENMYLNHSDNLRSEYKFRFTESERGTSKSQGKSLGANLTHDLYDSLTTRVSGSVSRTESGNDTKTDRYGAGLSFIYRKKNPLGTFSGRYSQSFSTSEQSGRSGIGSVVSESHSAVTGLIQLDRPLIDRITIVVHDGIGGIYDEGFDYDIIEDVDRILFRLHIAGGGPNTADFSFLDGSETFFVDYDYSIGPEKETTTDNWSIRLEQSFHNFSVFYDHSERDQDVTSDEALVTPDNNQKTRQGLRYRKGNFSFLSELFENNLTQIKTTGKRFRAFYKWRIGHETNVNVHAFQEFLEIEEKGRSTAETSLLTLGANVASRLSERHFLSVNMDYMIEENEQSEKTDGFQLGSVLQYKYRQLAIDLGLSYDLLSRKNSDRSSTTVFLRMRRFF